MDGWLKADESADSLHAMFQMFGSDRNGDPKTRGDEIEREIQAKKRGRKGKNERAVLLKAKLIRLRDAMEAQAFLDQEAQR